MLVTLMKRSTIIATIFLISFNAHARASEMAVSVPAGDLAPALESLGKQFGVDVIYPSEQIRGLKTQGVSGTVETYDAFRKLLEGTPLILKEESGAVLITLPKMPLSSREEREGEDFSSPLDVSGEGPGVRASRDEGAKGFWSRLRLAQSSPSSPGDGRRVGDEGSQEQGDSENISPDPTIDEIVVTGSHIRGVAPVGSPLVVIQRDEIERSGRGTIADFLETIPQDFSNESENFSDPSSGAQSLTRGRSVNLRGLGAGATLVLVNGRRQPGGDLYGAQVDISSIPAAAVDRIEILTDGASAIYGADAVGGVVNFVLRRRFDGIDANLRIASTDELADEAQASALWGKSWSSGSVLAAYEYSHRDSLACDTGHYCSTNRDFREFGGSDVRSTSGWPATILLPNRQPAFAIPAGQNGLGLTIADLIPGQANYADSVTNIARAPEQITSSFFATINQSFGDNLEAFADARYTKREMTYPFSLFSLNGLTVPSTNPYYINPLSGTSVSLGVNFGSFLGVQTIASDTESFGANLGATAHLGARWKASLVTSWAKEEVDYASYNGANTSRVTQCVSGLPNSGCPGAPLNLFGDLAANDPASIAYIRSTAVQNAEFEVYSGSLVLDGPVIDFGTGPVSLAVGTDFRKERIDTFRGELAPATGVLVAVSSSSTGTVGPLSREVFAAFGELNVPLLRGDVLTMSVAGRYEDYSDFGGNFSPKLGVNFRPLTGILLRGSWSESFRAPRFHELSGGYFRPVAGAAIVAEPGSPSVQALFLSGVNPDLHEETAKTWTAGADAKFHLGGNFTISATYFDIAYRDKISRVTPAIAYANPAVWGSLIQRNPTRSEIDSICADPNYREASCPATVAAIIDTRLQNIGGVKVQGLDVSVSGTFDLPVGSLTISTNNTILFEYSQAASRSGAYVSVLDTPGNPVDWRMRSSVAWNTGEWGLSAAVNYTDAYFDIGGNRQIDAWTTVDTAVTFNATKELRLGLYVNNVFDEPAPLVNNTQGFDGASASDIGRTVSVSLRKSW